jgi:hypothetical protein
MAAFGLLGPSANALGVDWQVVSLVPKDGGNYVTDTVNTTFGTEFQTPIILPAGQVTMEVAAGRTLGQDGTLADEKRVGLGLLSRGDSDPSKWSGSFTTQAFGVPGTYYFQYSYTAVQSSGTVAYCGAPLGTTVSCTYITPVMSFHVGYLTPYSSLTVAAAKAKALSVVRARFHARNPKVDWCRRMNPNKIRCRVSWRLRSGVKDARTILMYGYLSRVGVTKITR